jgi:hypothetical protein
MNQTYNTDECKKGFVKFSQVKKWFDPIEGNGGSGTKITYKSKNGKKMTKMANETVNIYAVKSDEPGYVHVWNKYNTFEKKKTKVRKNWIETRRVRGNPPEHVCGNKMSLSIKPFPDEIKGLKSYYTLDNGSKPFLVFVKGDTELHIYRIPENVHIDYDEYEKLKKGHYNELIKSYKTKKIWIGKHTEKDGYWNQKNSAGNSILAQLSNNRYLHIGADIYEFTTPDNDKIIKYFSKIGNNEVPYPIALGEKYVYQMLNRAYITRKAFENWDMTDAEWDNTAYILYGHDENKQIDEKYKQIKMPGIKVISNRL